MSLFHEYLKFSNAVLFIVPRQCGRRAIVEKLGLLILNGTGIQDGRQNLILIITFYNSASTYKFHCFSYIQNGVKNQDGLRK